MVRVCNELLHDSLVELVEQELKYRGYKELNIEKFTDYRHPNGDGEIDIFARANPDYILLFEVKCGYSTKNKNKAKKQMDRAERNYFSRYNLKRRIFKFLVTYDQHQEDGYKIQWIPDTYTPGQ